MAASTSQAAVNRITGNGKGATPVCPVAINRGLLIVSLATPELANIAARKIWTAHRAAFMVTVRDASKYLLLRLRSKPPDRKGVSVGDGSRTPRPARPLVTARAEKQQDVPMEPKRPTRERIVDEAMRLFGERGYAATTIADIESAAGLSSGSGGLYRHFASKRAVLEAGVQRQIDSNSKLLQELAQRPADAASLTDKLRAMGNAGIDRLDRERDLSRLLLHDLRNFPDLLALAASNEIQPVHAGLAAWLTRENSSLEIDAQAFAAVLAGATAHYWLLRDIFGEHPSGVSQQRYVTALAQMIELVLTQEGPEPG
jgi:AcrR family transcriptional regulator